MESIYDYGARAGFWRLHRLFGPWLPVTVYGVATALARAPEQVAAMQAAGWEIASHGLKWVEHRDMPEEVERAQILEAIGLHTEVTGARPTRLVHRPLFHQHRAADRRTGAFDWISDTYDDDLPYWIPRRQGARPAGHPLHAGCQRHALRHRRRGSTRATTSSPICATASTASTPRARRGPRR
jgi:peptidoglycan/xylan/chitin deacetylase (PgdA/CDA1 family)